mmetsp:Transcript_111812/g.280081  ORF Transcript_111812/g.280081 Transcript_111812/m.280081 type:complete len:225 (+) Transcript_111812:444-1118(+)
MEPFCDRAITRRNVGVILGAQRPTIGCRLHGRRERCDTRIVGLQRRLRPQKGVCQCLRPVCRPSRCRLRAPCSLLDKLRQWRQHTRSRRSFLLISKWRFFGVSSLLARLLEQSRADVAGLRPLRPQWRREHADRIMHLGLPKLLPEAAQVFLPLQRRVVGGPGTFVAGAGWDAELLSQLAEASNLLICFLQARAVQLLMRHGSEVHAMVICSGAPPMGLKHLRR